VNEITLDSTIARWLVRELSTPIDLESIWLSPQTAIRIDQMAEKIFSSPEAARGRTFEKVREDCIHGKLGELAIVRRLERAGMHVVWNVEKESGQYFWDVSADGYLLELKAQSRYDANGNPRQFFSFSEEDMHRMVTPMSRWRDFHAIIAWVLVASEVRPWFLIDASMLNPELKYWVQSNYKSGGRYLQMGKVRSAGGLRSLCSI